VSSAAWPRYRSAPLADDVAKAAALLKQAKRPVILAGGGSFAVQAGAEILSLAEKLGAPIVTSINGKGVVDERHPLAAGVIGVFGDVRASTILKSADVVLVLGSKFAQFNSFMWRLPEAQQTIIHVDLDRSELGRAIPSVLPIVADARETAIHIAAAIGDGKRPVWAFKQATPPQPGTAPDDPAIAPEAVMEAINAQSDERTILVSDASLSSGWTASRYTVKGAGRKYISPRGLAGIGWAGGAAIGAAAAAPKGARIVAVAGDGAAGYWLGEMETAARFNLHITYVVLNNSGYGWVVQGERMLGTPPQSTFGAVDFSSVARGLGVPAVVVEKGADLGAEVARSFGANGPHLLDIRSSDQSSPSVDYALLDPDAASAYGAYGMG
ncbi:MAG: thiamine pyrophosphate-binding protein, partial [Alphaproteobacteria bacterium]|nr:thiamine pyrophosphate-binding protein [Alphaproteobacteria bacterium]